MDIYASDDEKGEDIKRWWRENGRSVIAVSILGIAVIFAGRYWLGYQQTQSENAAITYQQLTNLVAEGQHEGADEQNQLLLSEFATTPYAVFAALEMANQAITDDDDESAKSYYEWVINNAKLNGHVEIARLRLAKLYLAEDNYEKAIQLVSESTSESFSSLYSELRGDIFAEQGQNLEARAAYQSAILNVVEGEPRRIILNMKIDDMAVVDAS